MNHDKEFELNLNSPAFSDFCENLNHAILQCLHELYEGNFAGGDIAAKISIDLESDSQYIPTEKKDDAGKTVYKTYHYKKPAIEHKVTITLKKRAETKGEYNPLDMELKQDKKGKRFILSKVQTAQLSLLDTEVQS